MIITKETKVQEVLDKCKGSDKIFESHDMQCDQCTGARGETLEEAAIGHGIDIETLISELTNLEKTRD